ncbi:MAG: GNAT family N-acetyltransferase [Hyphomicrobiaceae bacterium]|nr:GNAT family N-acetyltransferase [Hyphomicrobiaceae bacterium]
MRKRTPATAAKPAARQPTGEAPDRSPNPAAPVRIRRAAVSDIPQITELDERVTRIAKPDYWRDVFYRYGSRRQEERFFLVAEHDQGAPAAPLLGFIVGEVRAWEFGSEPCGWVFAFSVDPKARQQYIGERLFGAISEMFRAAGIRTMRTMVARDNQLHLAFFRSEGMMAGHYIQLEKELD